MACRLCDVRAQGEGGIATVLSWGTHCLSARAAKDRRFILLDRDGTIIVNGHYLSDPEKIEFLPGAVGGLRRLAQRGFGLAVVTNQSGVGRGLVDLPALEAIHDRLFALLRSEGVVLDGIFYCPHLPEEGCQCRKPRPGLLLNAAARFEFDPARAFMIGDQPSDIQAGRAVGATTILIAEDETRSSPSVADSVADQVAPDLESAADYIERIIANQGAPLPT